MRDQKPAVAFLGPECSFTHQAAAAVFPEDEWTYTPATNVQDIFELVASKKVAYGVTPVENSTYGPVVATLDCLADRDSRYESVYVCGEVYLAVEQHLLGFINEGASSDAVAAPSSSSSPQTSPAPAPSPPKPLHPLTHLKRIYSHPVGHGQTSRFRQTHLSPIPGIEIIDTSSTSRAAQLAAADSTRSSAAIASAMAAKHHGLDVLARNIEDRADNQTRFLVICCLNLGEGSSRSSAGAWVPPFLPSRLMSSSSPDTEAKEVSGGGGESHQQSISLVSFTVPHQGSPGALAKVLQVFGTHGLDMTSINSRPSHKQPFQYLFFVEFEGSRLEDSEDGRRVEKALGEIGEAADESRWWGSWVRGRVYR